MDEKKVREAIYCMKVGIGEAICEECVNYYKCDHTKMDDMMRVAIEALEKQLPENTKVIYTLPETCTACHFWLGSMDQPGGMCEITGDETDTESGVWDEKRMDNCPIDEQSTIYASESWIPISEGLPEVPEGTEDAYCPEFNVTIKGADKATTLKYSPDGTWFDDYGVVYKVTAWKPLPEAYKKE